MNRDHVFFEIYTGDDWSSLSNPSNQKAHPRLKHWLMDVQRTYLYHILKQYGRALPSSYRDTIEDILHQHYYYDDQREFLNGLKREYPVKVNK